MSQPIPPFEQVFRDVVSTLEELPFPYCVLGALALGVWGVPRTTQDVDVMVAVAEHDQPQLHQMLSHHHFLFDAHWADANPLLRSWHLRFKKGAIPVDVLLPRDAHDQLLITRRQRYDTEGFSFWVIAPEDLILHKLKAGRPRDFEDAVAVLARQASRLDPGYLQDWAQRLVITEELAYCLGRSH